MSYISHAAFASGVVPNIGKEVLPDPDERDV